MSKIALFIDSFGENKAKCMLLIAKIFSRPITEMQKNFEEKRPVVEQKIFDRSCPEFPENLAALFKKLDDLECRWRAFELLDNQTWDSSATYFEITLERLESMISARANSIRQQGRIASLEAGEE